MNWAWMLAGTYLLYAITMVLMHPRFIYPFGADALDDPAFQQMVVGERQVAVAISEGDDPAAVLFFMGNGGALAYFTFTLDAHRNAGRTIAAMEYPGGGGIGGRPSEVGLKADALAAFDWLAEQHDGPIVVHGFSLGTGLALHVAARRPVAAVILDAPYMRLCRLMAKASYLPACLIPGVQKWQSADDVPQVDVPVLIQHGTADQLIPMTEGQAMAALMESERIAVTFLPIADATHNNLAGQPGYPDRINGFLEGHLP